MLIKYDVGWGQNESCESIFCQEITLNNKNLSYSGPRGKVGTINSVGIESFFLQRVSSWQSGSLTPHTIDYDVSDSDPCRWTLDDPILQGRVERNCIASNSSVKESVFQILPNNHRFDPSVDYCIEVDMQLLRCGINNSFETDIELRSAKGLINSNGAFPTNAVSELIERRSVNSLDARKFVFSFTPQAETNQNLWKDQIWVIADASSSNTAVVSINDITIKCRTNALTSLNTIDLENNTYRFNGIGSKIFETYSWTINEVPVLNNDENLLIHNFNEVGEYQVCLWVTDEYGCCGIECTEIIICEQPDSPEISIRENFCSSYTFSIENPDPTMSYTWNILGGSPSTGTGTMFSTMLNVPNGFYTISVSGQNNCETVHSTESFAFQCSTEPSSCINQVNCVSIGENANSVTLLSSLIFGDHPVIPSTQVFFGYEVRNLCFSVQGKLIVDVGTIFFTNTNWFMGPGAEIELNPVFWGSRYFIDSQFQGCDMMWRGIVVKAAPNLMGFGGLSLTGTTIKDAWRGVELDDNTTFVSQNSNFFDNYIGIYTIHGRGKKNKVHAEFSNNLFEDLDNMLPPYPGQPDYSVQSHTGISVNGCENMTIGLSPVTKNIFKNLIIGIQSLNTNILNCQGNDFIDTYMIQSGERRSKGVFIIGSGVSTQIASENNFTNLYKGVEITRSRGVVAVHDNTFTNHRPIPSIYINGITSHINIGISLEITENDFNFSTGMCIHKSGNANIITISENIVHFTGNSRFLFQEGTKGRSYIKDNIITFAENITFSSQVFWFDYCQNVNAINNQILEPSGFTPARTTVGFLLRGCQNSLFRNNNIDIHSKAFNVAGVEYSQGNAYCCNTANNTYVENSLGDASFRFSDTKGISFVRQNDLRILGLYGNSSEIGPQKNAGNNWRIGDSKAYMENATFDRAQENEFLVDGSEPLSTPFSFEPPTIATAWFDVFGNEHPTCEQTPLCNLPAHYFTTGDVNISKFWPDPLPNDSVIIVVDPARPHCIVVQNLYQRLMVVDSLADPLEYWYLVTALDKWRTWQGETWFLSCLGTFYDVNLDVSVWNDTEKDKDDIYEFDQIIRDQANQLVIEISILSDELQVFKVDSLLRLDSIALIKYNELEALNTELDSILQEVQIEVEKRAFDLIAVVQSLPAPLLFLNDKKTVWIAELKIISEGLSSLDSSDWNTIRGIARKCPEEYGQAVYIAKHLMMMIEEYVETDTACASVKIRSSKNNEPKININVSPNPGDGTFYFQSSSDTNIVEISVFNTSGMKVYNKVVSEKTNQVMIDISQYNLGMYFWEVKTENNTIVTGKIIKI